MEIIVGKTAGFCFGVKRAVLGAIKEKDNKKIYCLGELVHNEDVINDLKKQGIIFINSLDEVKENDNVIIRAHGVPQKIYEEALKKKINIIDYTCPNVLKIHDIASIYSNKAYIILCGSIIHPENIGTISYCGNYYSVIEEVNELYNVLEKYKESNLKKVLLISQTTYSLDKFNLIKNELEKVLKNNLIVKNTICRATELRQNETKEIAKNVDCMIIIGGKNSSNTKKIFEIAKNNCPNTYLVNNEKELEIDKKYQKIGIMAGASTPDESIQKVLRKLGK